jgi:hypothetical protein
MDLFKRFPKVRLAVSERDLIPEGQKSAYPAFAEDFAILQRELLPAFYELDRQAQQRQNAYRWMYVILIFGGSLATILGIIQLVVADSWVGIAGAVVAALLGMITLYSRSLNHQERYLNARISAELLRSEYFLFLGRFTPYNNEKKQREALLIERVTEIKSGENNHGEA